MKVHEKDQIQAALRDMAILTKEYHEQLTKAGFNKLEALRIIAIWSAHMMNGNK